MCNLNFNYFKLLKIYKKLSKSPLLNDVFQMSKENENSSNIDFKKLRKQMFKPNNTFIYTIGHLLYIHMLYFICSMHMHNTASHQHFYLWPLFYRNYFDLRVYGAKSKLRKEQFKELINIMSCGP